VSSSNQQQQSAAAAAMASTQQQQHAVGKPGRDLGCLLLDASHEVVSCKQHHKSFEAAARHNTSLTL
jgi:hypothetical protein